jgi:hypothetical protein
MPLTPEQQDAELNKLALRFATLQVISVFDNAELDAWLDGKLTDEEFFESDNTGLWEPFEDYSTDSIVEMVDDIQTSYIGFYHYAKHIMVG